MKAIAAVNNDWGIGSGGQLLYHIPEDMKFFRRMTEGKVVILGRKTLQTFPGGRPLKNRVNLIMTRDPDFTAEGAVICTGVEDMLQKAAQYPSDDLMVIGGAEIYELLLPMCDTVYITKIDDSKAADKFFPDLDKAEGWTLSETSEEYEHEGIKYKFCTYVKA